MANKKSFKQNEGADFSHFFKSKDESEAKHHQKEALIEELPVEKANKRMRYLIYALIILALGQFLLYYLTQKSQNPGLPEGYELIQAPGQPPQVAPIQR